MASAISHLAALRNARQAVRHRLTADHQHALVALGNGRQELLHHHGLRAVTVQRLDDGTQVQAVVLDAEDAHAAHAVQRLQDDVAVLGVEGAHGQRIARDQGRAGELRKLQDGKLLRMVTQGTRLVENFRTFALSLLQQMGGVEVLAVEGWILAHDDGIEIA